MFKINLNDSMLYFGLYVQLRRGSVAGYTTDESWAYGPKEGVEAFESITFFIRFIYAINFEHLLKTFPQSSSPSPFCGLPLHVLALASAQRSSGRGGMMSEGYRILHSSLFLSSKLSTLHYILIIYILFKNKIYEYDDVVLKGS